MLPLDHLTPDEIAAYRERAARVDAVLAASTGTTWSEKLTNGFAWIGQKWPHAITAVVALLAGFSGRYVTEPAPVVKEGPVVIREVPVKGIPQVDPGVAPNVLPGVVKTNPPN